MRIDISLKNYRCFQDCHPAHITLQPGFIAFLGSNNSGKSSLLKFFYEFRGLFQSAARDPRALASALIGEPQAFNLPPTVTDTEEMFCNANDRDMRVIVRVQPDDPREVDSRWPDELAFTIPHDRNTWQAKVSNDGKRIAIANDCQVIIRDDKQFLQTDGSVRADRTGYFRAFGLLAQTLYIGPFRNAINMGTKQDFTDAAVKKVKGDRYRALGPYESLKAVPLRWGKAENWRIAREMSVDDIAATDLGKFLAAL
jgi:hypothetical protein